MKNFLKSFARTTIRKAIAVVEPFAGFQTDPTGYLPNRIKMITGSYEKFLTRSICAALPEKGVFVDVGANVGFISQQVARKFKNARVFAFEPNPRIYQIIEKNLKFFPNCQVHHVGLGAKEGQLEFFHGDESCVGSFVQEYTSHHPSNSARGPIAKSIVQVKTGDTMLAQVGTIDVMKMDVEGYEIEVLKGMAKLLATGGIKTIFFEFFPFAHRWAHHQPEDIIHLLIASGYSIYEMEGVSSGRQVTVENSVALIVRLGDNGYTTLRANAQSSSKKND